jgi:hypothetical protein
MGDSNLVQAILKSDHNLTDDQHDAALYVIEETGVDMADLEKVEPLYLMFVRFCEVLDDRK